MWATTTSTGIGSYANLETHIFQIFPEDSATDTVEWVAMDDAAYSVFVPYYPMLTTDTYAAYQLSTLPATFSEEEPADGPVYYASTTTERTEEGRETVEGFRVLPENWADSMYCPSTRCPTWWSWRRERGAGR